MSYLYLPNQWSLPGAFMSMTLKSKWCMNGPSCSLASSHSEQSSLVNIVNTGLLWPILSDLCGGNYYGIQLQMVDAMKDLMVANLKYTILPSQGFLRNKMIIPTELIGKHLSIPSKFNRHVFLPKTKFRLLCNNSYKYYFLHIAE